MPIIKQAIKRVKQDKGRTARNKHYKHHMKSMIRLMLDTVRQKEGGKAVKLMPKVISSIDTCAKKNLIHKNNAARKKARLQKALSRLQKGGGEKTEKKEVIETKKTSKKKTAPKTKKKTAKKK